MLILLAKYNVLKNVTKRVANNLNGTVCLDQVSEMIIFQSSLTTFIARGAEWAVAKHGLSLKLNHPRQI